MQYTQQLEDDFYIALVRSAVNPDRVAEVKQRALRNGVATEDLHIALAAAQARVGEIGFTYAVGNGNGGSGDLPVGPTDIQVFCIQGAVRICSATYNGQRILMRDLDGPKLEPKQKLEWQKSEQDYAQKLRSSPRFLHITGSLPESILVEYINGTLLSEEIQQNGKFDSAKALTLATQILLGLDELHKKGLTYCYPDPARILVYAGKIIFLDWGIALESKGDPLYAPPSRPEYLPPEPSGGIRGDVYAFGMLLLEMLTGKPDPALIRQLPTRQLQKVVQKCLHKEPQNRYQNCDAIRKDLTHRKKRKKVWLMWVIAAMILAGAGCGYYWAVLMRTEPMYVIGTNVHFRATPNDQDRLPEKRSFGDVVKVKKIEGDYATVKENGQTLYFPKEYLVDEQSYLEINAIYGNQEARSQLVSSYQRLAIWNYFRLHNLIGDLKPGQFNPESRPEVWQFFGRSPEAKSQSFFSGTFTYKYGVKYAWMGIIISKKDSPTTHRRLLLFSFNAAHQSYLEFEFDLSSYPDSYFQLVSQRRYLKDFDKKYLQEISTLQPGILFESSNSTSQHLVVFFQGKFVWIAPSPKPLRYREAVGHSASYRAYKAELDILKDDIRKYYLTNDKQRRQQLLREIPEMINQYGLIMDGADRKFLENTLTRIL